MLEKTSDQSDPVMPESDPRSAESVSSATNVDAMVARLRAPVDQGGYDGYHQEPFYLRIADTLESLAKAHGTAQEMHAAWRKRAEESESELSSCREMDAKVRVALGSPSDDRTTEEGAQIISMGLEDLTKCLAEAETDLSSCVAERDALLVDTMALRKMVWLSHGCVGIYGDDGEMQCGKCVIDFRRDPVDEINRRLMLLRVAAMQVSQGVEPGEPSANARSTLGGAR
jgi:hypothetical protein